MANTNTKTCVNCSLPAVHGARCEAHVVKAAEWDRARRARAIQNGLCVRCSERAVEGLKFCEKHRVENQQRSRATQIKRRAAGMCRKCGRPPEKGFRLCRKDREVNRLYLRRHRPVTKDHQEALWAEVLKAYGEVCACCREDEPLFLTIDHVHGRKRGDKASGTNFYAKVRKQGFPQDRYQLLCINCNQGRFRNGGTCPHESHRNQPAWVAEATDNLIALADRRAA